MSDEIVYLWSLRYKKYSNLGWSVYSADKKHLGILLHGHTGNSWSVLPAGYSSVDGFATRRDAAQFLLDEFVNGPIFPRRPDISDASRQVSIKGDGTDWMNLADGDPIPDDAKLLRWVTYGMIFSAENYKKKDV